MKKILISLLLTSAMTGFSQVPLNESSYENEDQIIFPEENFETDSIQQKHEEFEYPPLSENTEDYLAEEEIYDTNSDYND